MLIFDGDSKPIMLDSIFTPTLAEHVWVLDLANMDYMLAPLTTLEQVVCPSLKVRIQGFEFIVPASWSVLVYDRETLQLDTVEFAEAAGREFTALVYGPTKARHEPGMITVVDYYIDHVNVAPAMNKSQMLCHPIGPNEWVTISPSDCFNKYLKDQTVCDIIGG